MTRGAGDKMHGVGCRALVVGYWFTSRTGTLKAASSLWSVGAARLELQLRIKRRGGGALLG